MNLPIRSWLVLTPGLVGTLWSADPPSPPVLVAELRFSSAGTPARFVATNRIRGTTCEVRRAVGTEPTRAGTAIVFGGHPEQGVTLGSLDLQPPATILFWVKRAAAPVAHPAGKERPEYAQEHAAGRGRLLSPATGQPRGPGSENLSGFLSIAPDGVRIWYGKERWKIIIPGPLPADRWLHLAIAFDQNGEATGYLDGRRHGGTRATFEPGPLPVALFAAALDKGYGYPFAGAVDEVRLYQGTLDDAAIAALASQSPER
jgi:hypothetical protein